MVNNKPDALLVSLLSPAGGEAELQAVSGPLATVRARLTRPPSDRSRAAVHALPAPHYRPGLRTMVRDALTAQVVIEWQPITPRPPRRVDELLAAHGATPRGAIRVGFEGCIVRADRHGEALVLRVGPGAPAEAGALAALAGAGAAARDCAPRLIRSGSDPFPWVLETTCAGRQPRRLTHALVDQAGRFLAALPAGDGPASWKADLDVIRTNAPGYDDVIDALGAGLDALGAEIPTVMRHGDFWSGNLLVDRGALRGVVDWDAWQPAGFPGTDLLHLVATEWRHRHRSTLGGAFAARIWQRDTFLRPASTLWAAAGCDTTLPSLAGNVARAWWAGQVAGDLRRSATLRSDGAWMRANVFAVLAQLRAGQ